MRSRKVDAFFMVFCFAFMGWYAGESVRDAVEGDAWWVLADCVFVVWFYLWGHYYKRERDKA